MTNHNDQPEKPPQESNKTTQNDSFEIDQTESKILKKHKELEDKLNHLYDKKAKRKKYGKARREFLHKNVAKFDEELRLKVILISLKDLIKMFSLRMLILCSLLLVCSYIFDIGTVTKLVAIGIFIIMSFVFSTASFGYSSFEDEEILKELEKRGYEKEFLTEEEIKRREK
jgi:magnesium-transporting ATPase (P-type)